MTRAAAIFLPALVLLLLSSSTTITLVHAYSLSMMAPLPSTSKLSKLPKLPPSVGAPLDAFYDEVRKQATEAAQAALKQGVEQLEIEFPISPGRIDVSLGEFLDDSRTWTREFIRPFTPKGPKLWVVFPDGKEATLAGQKWGGGNFRIMSLKGAIDLPKDEPCELQVVVTPGFNIEEFIQIEKVRRPNVPMIVVNGNLDRVRGGYYPRLFYPNLYNVKERMLKFFEPVYYLKAAQGGFIYRKYPEDWQQVLTYYDPSVKKGSSSKKNKEILSKVVKTTIDRPQYNDVVNVLKQESLRMAKEAAEEAARLEEEERAKAAARRGKK